MKYDYISKTFVGPTGLDANMTLDELVTLVARNTTLTAEQVEKALLDVVNGMLELVDE